MGSIAMVDRVDLNDLAATPTRVSGGGHGSPVFTGLPRYPRRP
jgi:hypothetical protein